MLCNGKTSPLSAGPATPSTTSSDSAAPTSTPASSARSLPPSLPPLIYDPAPVAPKVKTEDTLSLFSETPSEYSEEIISSEELVVTSCETSPPTSPAPQETSRRTSPPETPAPQETSSTSAVTFQDLLNEAHVAIADGSCPNTVDDLMDTHVRTGPMPSPMVPTQFCCEICGKSFTQLWILDRHYSSSHGGGRSREAKCKCGKPADSPHACLHKCSHCIQSFPDRIQLRNHVVKLHSQSIRRKCNICEAEFSSQQLLIRHRIECELQKKAASEEVGASDGSVRCDNCSDTLTTSKHLVTHRANHALLSHQCLFCKERFCVLNRLFPHVWKEHRMNAHLLAQMEPGDPANPYVCPICGEHSRNYKLYTYHLTDIHESNPTYALDARNQRVLKRKSMYDHHTYLEKKYVMLAEGDSWEFEGSYKLPRPCFRPAEYDPYDPNTDHARNSARLESKCSGDAPTMLGKKSTRTEELLELKDRTRKSKGKKRGPRKKKSTGKAGSSEISTIGNGEEDVSDNKEGEEGLTGKCNSDNFKAKIKIRAK